MADYPGLLVPSSVTVPTYAFPAGLFRYGGDVSSLKILQVPPIDKGTYAAGTGGHSIPAGTASIPGKVAQYYNNGFDWFDRLHLIPRKVFAFGTILSQVTDTFELFNAWRSSVVLTSLVNPLPSVTIPDLPATPATLSAFCSFVDVDSPGLKAYTDVGFGVSFIPLSLVVAKDGPPTMDDDIDFVFGTGQTLTISLTGTRVSIILPLYEAEFEEVLNFISDGKTVSDNGTEQWRSLVANPVQSFNLSFVLDGVDRQRLQNLLHGASPALLALPLVHEQTVSTATASVSATTITVRSTTDLDFRVGGYAQIWESDTKYDIVKISALTSTSLTFATTPLINSYSTNARVSPVRLGYIVSDAGGRRYINNAETVQLTFLVDDNDTGAQAGSTSGWSIYNSKVLLDDPNVVQQTMDHGFVQEIYIVDNDTGVIQQSSNMAKAMRRAAKGFGMHSRAEIAKVKRLLIALRGPQVSFRIPTFINDLNVVANLVISSTTMDIEHIGYTKFVGATEPKKHFRIEFTDGTTLDREIASSVEVSNTVERLTLTSSWPANRTVAEIRRVMFLELTRFVTPQFVFRYRRFGSAELTAVTRTLIA